MTPENRELLSKDLCGRVPYEVIVCIDGTTNAKLASVSYWEEVEVQDGSRCLYDISDIKPYLFPLSSMTEEQKKEYYSLADDVTIEPGHDCRLGIKIHCIKLGISDNPHEEVWDYIDLDALDWLNKNHFDYRGLIKKGLAIDATNLNIY